MKRRSFLKGTLATAPLLLGPGLLASGEARADQGKGGGPRVPHHIGPSTKTEPYLVPSAAGVQTVSILTVGDRVDGYRMVGIPDGLGAFEGPRNSFTLLSNHEIIATLGIPRAHGSKGAFVSAWTINPKTLEVTKGEDLTPSADAVHLWDQASGKYVAGTTTIWERLCSADLAKEGAFSYRGLGTKDRIFLNGEEVTQGRAWARIASGKHKGEAWQLPRLGRVAFENAVASPHPQLKTVVVMGDDSALSTAPNPAAFPSEVYVYVGTKTKKGHPIEQAGLTNGHLFGVAASVDGKPVTEESNAFGLGTSAFVGKGRFALRDLGDVTNLGALELEQMSIAAGVTRLQRPEDGAWDPRSKHRDDFYFVTTASLTSNCRLWRLRFDDVEEPELGGTIEILLKGDEGHGMLDNVTIDRRGRILMDEDPGNSDRIAKIWLYQIATGELIQVAEHNPKFFTAGSPDFITQDEESSGLIDARHVLGEGWFLLTVQAHRPNADPELVEGGQFLALYVDPSIGRAGKGRGKDDDDFDEDEG
ncbi:MAG: phytase [Candidatus Rokuibacteriota bacterium]